MSTVNESVVGMARGGGANCGDTEMLEGGLTERLRMAGLGGEGAAAAPVANLAFAVSETFTSVQGEGKLTGTRSHFIRLSGCNLRCRWCDTPYASWDAGRAPRRREAGGGAKIAAQQRQSLPVLHDGARVAIGALVETARASGAGHVVVTGGEPLIFAGVTELCRSLMAAGLHVTVETAGTVAPGGAGRGEKRIENREQRMENADRGGADAAGAGATHARAPDARAIGLSPVCSLISLSPKLASSTPLPGDPRDPTGAWRRRHEQRRLDFNAMQALIDSAPDRQIKFVVTSPRDLPEIESVLGRLRDWAPQDIFLMPEGVTVPDAATRAWVAAAAAERGWRYGRRLHIELFGNTRGT